MLFKFHNLTFCEFLSFVTINEKQGRGCSSGNKSAQPTTLTSGYSLLYSTMYSLLYSTMYSLQYIVHCTVQSSIGIGLWGVLTEGLETMPLKC